MEGNNAITIKEKRMQTVSACHVENLKDICPCRVANPKDNNTTKVTCSLVHFLSHSRHDNLITPVIKNQELYSEQSTTLHYSFFRGWI